MKENESKVKPLKAFHNVAKLSRNMGISEQTGFYRFRNGLIAKIELPKELKFYKLTKDQVLEPVRGGKQFFYVDISKVVESAKKDYVVRKSVDGRLVNSGWPIGKKRNPLEVTEVSGNTVTNIQVSQA